MRALILASTLCAIWLTGCESLDRNEVSKNERVYVTGSNIAHKPSQANDAPVQGRTGDDIRTRPGGLPEFVGAPECYRGVNPAACNGGR